MMKITKLFMVFIMTVIFTSCSSNGANEASVPRDTIPPGDSGASNYTPGKLSDRDIELFSEFNGNLDALKEEYDSSLYIREVSYGYLVAFPGETKAAINHYDTAGDKLYSEILGIASASSERFSNLAGSTLADVQAIDPNGQYLFLYAGRTDIPRQSIHYTADGYYIIVKYDDNLKVIDVNKENF